MFKCNFEIWGSEYSFSANTVNELYENVYGEIYTMYHWGCVVDVTLEGNTLHIIVEDEDNRENIVSSIICEGVAGVTADGEAVYYHPMASHSHRPELDGEVLGKIAINGGSFCRSTVNLHRIIGVDHLVETGEDDEIVYFCRGNREYYSRMVVGRKAEPTTKVTVIVARCTVDDGHDWDGKFVLVTLFEGDPGMPENSNSPEAEKFWMGHALVPTRNSAR